MTELGHETPAQVVPASQEQAQAVWGPGLPLLEAHLQVSGLLWLLGQWGAGVGSLPDEAPPPSRFAGKGYARTSKSTDPETALPSAAATGCVGLGVKETCRPCLG